MHPVVLHPVAETVALEGLTSQLQDRSAVDGDQSCGTRFQGEQAEQTAAAPHVDHHVVGPDQVAQSPSVCIDLDRIGHVTTVLEQFGIRHVADRTEVGNAERSAPTARFRQDDDNTAARAGISPSGRCWKANHGERIDNVADA